MPKLQSPSTKVTNSTVSLAVTAVLLWLIEEAWMEIPAGIETSILLLVTFGVGYMVREDNPSQSAIEAVNSRVVEHVGHPPGPAPEPPSNPLAEDG